MSWMKAVVGLVLEMEYGRAGR